ncbi:hypothetical protein M408DRAFT_7766 [Serendipita vermifera MAFF 305830]|uniref:C2H2-type domain-containing protein n=1 Tax=Serendipita vermifera MAFF 305830 TaxID=933852 RepID=A0A0C3BDP9_SERVB|nr:hypothetical protein M408DRAFT_7766 [Serendipita vermifera MAFF 305830]
MSYDHGSYMPAQFQTRQPPTDSVFDLDMDGLLPTSSNAYSAGSGTSSPLSPPSLSDAAGKFAGSFISDNAIHGRIANPLAPIDEGTFEPIYNQHQHQQQFQTQSPQDSLSFNTMEPAPRNGMSNLSKQLQNHGTITAGQFDNYMATSPSMNTGSYLNSYGQAAGSSVHNHFLARSVNGQQDPFTPMKTDEDFEFNLLSPIALSPQTPAWATGGTQPMGIPSNRPHGRTSSMSSTNSLRSHPYSRGSSSLRHELTHQAQSLPCTLCDKVYTRNDNLKRHIQLKHSGASLPTQAPISMSLPIIVPYSLCSNPPPHLFVLFAPLLVFDARSNFEKMYRNTKAIGGGEIDGLALTALATFYD